MELMPSAGTFEKLFCDCIKITYTIMFRVFEHLPNPRVITCCSPHRVTHRAATHYHTLAWQTSVHGKPEDRFSHNEALICSDNKQRRKKAMLK